MKYQSQFNRVLEIEDPALSRQITRHLFAEFPNTRKPLTAEEAEAIKSQGIQLNCQRQFSHAQAVRLAREAAADTDERAIYNAFFCALDDRVLPLRAALRAYSAVRHLPAHRFSPWRDGPSSPCKECGYDRSRTESPLTSAHFVWVQGTQGGDADLVAAAWTLNWFRQQPQRSPGSDERQRLQSLLRIVDSAAPNCTAAQVASKLGSVLGGNKYSRETFLETLGFAGILSVPTLPGFLQKWTPWDRRPQTGEMLPPADLWKRSDGFDPDVFAQVFPGRRLPRGLRAAH